MGAPAPAVPALRVWSAFLGCAAIWGGTFLVISIGNDTVPPVWAATLRLALAAALLNLYLAARRRPWPRGAALRAAFSYGLLNFGINFPLLYWGETRVPSGLAAVIFAIIPLSSALFARALGLERLTISKVAGALVGLAGVALIFSGSFRGDVAALPLLAVLAAAIIASLGGALLRRGPRQSPVGANAVAAAVATPVSLLMSFAFGETHALPAGAAAVFPILYLTLAGSLGAFVLFAWLVNHWPITRISFISVVIPVVALALGAVVRHEEITRGSLAGSVLVLAGVLLGMRNAAH